MRVRAGIALAALMLMSPTGLASPALGASDLLPDMKMAPIYGIQVATTANGHKKLRFGTVAFNVGDAALEVRARNRSRGELLDVFQWVYRSDGTGRSLPKSKARVFYTGDGHDHWHVERFMVMRLTPNPGTATSSVRRIRKIGFCLVDSMRITASQRPPNASEFPVYGNCGVRASKRITVGVSVGWGDNYPPEFAFQAIPVDGLPAGSYRLCATVNPRGLWTEKNNNFSNNSYWLDIDLDVANDDVTVTDGGATACSS